MFHGGERSFKDLVNGFVSTTAEYGLNPTFLFWSETNCHSWRYYVPALAAMQRLLRKWRHEDGSGGVVAFAADLAGKVAAEVLI